MALRPLDEQRRTQGPLTTLLQSIGDTAVGRDAAAARPSQRNQVQAAAGQNSTAIRSDVSGARKVPAAPGPCPWLAGSLD